MIPIIFPNNNPAHGSLDTDVVITLISFLFISLVFISIVAIASRMIRKKVCQQRKDFKSSQKPNKRKNEQFNESEVEHNEQ